MSIRTGICLICLIALLLAGAPVMAQKPREGAGISLSLTAGTDMLLVLQMDSREILQCEPLRFTLTLANRTPEVQRVWAAWASASEVICVPDQGPSFVCGHSEGYAMDIRGEKEVKSGVALHSPGTLVLFRGKRPDPFVFRTPGRYRLKAQVEVNGEILESEEAVIFVKPVPEAETKAFELFQTIPLARAIQGWDLSEESAQQAAALVAAYPSSLYADHVRYFLGNYWRHKMFGGDPAERADAAEKSCAILGAVSPRIGALRIRALILMAQVAQYRVPDGRDSPEYKRLLEEIEAYRPLAECMGLESKVADISNSKTATQAQEDQQKP